MVSSAVGNGLRFLKRQRQSRAKKARTYILPTAFGVAFGLMDLVLFFMAVGYANNLIYIFFFFLTSVALTGMILTNRNVHAVEFGIVLPGDYFAGENSKIRVQLLSSRGDMSYEIETVLDRKTKDAMKITVSPAEESVSMLSWMPPNRGLQKLTRLRIQSSYPFGLLQAWKVIKEPGSVLVYPARVGDEAFPLGSGADSVAESMGLFLNHKVYQSGDPVRRIDWKASARRQETLLKKYEEPEKPALNFTWEQTESIMSAELRLSQLALWIDLAESQNYLYSLRLGGVQTPSMKGREHWKRCLETLARARTAELA